MPGRLSQFLQSFILLLIAPLFFGQICYGAESPMSSKIKISALYYFGYEGLDLQKIQDAIPLKSCEEIDQYKWGEYKNAIDGAVKKLTGKEASDAALVFTGKEHIVFIGLPGKSNNLDGKYLPVPEKRLAVPSRISGLYNELMDANLEQLKTGAQKDKDKYLQLREQIKLEAQKIPDLLMRALETSSDAMDRMVAAQALGLVANDRKRLDALVRAGRDSNSVVRNNSVRALGVLLVEKPELAKQIPPSFFIEMLNSPTWTDRNKGMLVVTGLTQSRDPQILGELQSHALPSLKEMCNWPMAYAGSAFLVIGRMAGIPDDKIGKLIEENKTDEIIEALNSVARAASEKR